MEEREVRPAGRHRRTGGATLDEVAALAGVSKMTVSRVLRGDGSFSAEAREKVMDAVSRTGYVPNRLAGSLASSRSTQVAVIVPTLSNIVFPEVLSGLSSVLEPAGFQPVLGVTEFDQPREALLVASMLSWRPCAVILAGLEHADATRTMLDAAGVPVVELMDIDGEPMDLNVGLSHTGAGAAMAAHFVTRGHRRIAYAGARLDIDTRARKRLDGFAARLAEAGLALADRELTSVTSSVRWGGQALAALMARNRDLDAVYFSNDDLAVGGVFHCLANGITVPDDIAIAGFNGLELGEALPRRLTTVRSPRFRMGQEAARMMLARLAGNTARLRIDTGFELIKGATA